MSHGPIISVLRKVMKSVKIPPYQPTPHASWTETETHLQSFSSWRKWQELWRPGHLYLPIPSHLQVEAGSTHTHLGELWHLKGNQSKQGLPGLWCSGSYNFCPSVMERRLVWWRERRQPPGGRPADDVTGVEPRRLPILLFLSPCPSLSSLSIRKKTSGSLHLESIFQAASSNINCILPSLLSPYKLQVLREASQTTPACNMHPYGISLLSFQHFYQFVNMH